MRIFAIGVAVWISAAAAQSGPVERMRALLDQGKPAEAYQLGRAHPDLLGQAQFDLFFGIAAVNAGKPAEGVLALERFTLIHPDHDTARLELARGYYLLGELARSREEFEALVERALPPPVRRVIDEYLDAIRARETRYQARAAWHVELGGGHDSNVPSGVEDPNINLPIFGDITLADSAVKRADRFAVLGGGVRFSLPLTPALQGLASLAGEQRANREIDTFDQEYFAGSVGLNWLIDAKKVARFSFSQSTQTLDHEKYRDSTNVNAELGWQLTPASSALLGFQGARFRHGGFNAVRDGDYRAATLGVRQRLPGRWRPDFDVAISAGKEEADLADRQDLSRDLRGFRLGLSLAPAAAWTVSLGATWLKSDYQAEDPLLQVLRADRYTGYDLGITYALPFAWTKNWSLRGEYSLARNVSNLALYEYKRRAGTLKLRFDFK